VMMQVVQGIGTMRTHPIRGGGELPICMGKSVDWHDVIRWKRDSDTLRDAVQFYDRVLQMIAV
jgi:hypothetical protein